VFVFGAVFFFVAIWSRLQPGFDNFIDRLEGLRVLESTMRNEQNSCGEASVLSFCS